METNKQMVELTADERAELEALRAKKAAEAEKEKKKKDRSAYKELIEDIVDKHINILINHHEATKMIVLQIFKDFQTIIKLKSGVYGNKIEEQDSHTSTKSDGSASITIGWNVSIGFDGTEAEGVKKIKEYLLSLSDDSEKVKKLSKMVNTFLKPNTKTGMLNPSKIIELSKLRDEFNDTTFDTGLDIILNAQMRCRNSMFISGWKYVQREDLPPAKIEFRFTI